MATSETEVTTPAKATPEAEVSAKATQKKADSILDKALALLSSVRFGIIMLSLLLVCCMIGMLIMQKNVEGFATYYQSLTPAKRDVYRMLGLFDIYQSWYFSLLLAITGLNIVLASIDRFPAAWQYVVKAKRKASPRFIAAQMFSAESEEGETPQEIAERVRAAWRKYGFRGHISEEENRITVFAQKNVWNRLGAYVVHVALLTIFIGGLLTSKSGVGGSMQISPGMKPSNEFWVTEISSDGKAIPEKRILPFSIGCRDIQQKLVRPEGGLDANNTIDWLSFITIVDEKNNVRKDLDVHLNNVGDYNGYRFFQSMFDPVGNARRVTILLKPLDGRPERELKDLARGEKREVDGIGQIEWVDFTADFSGQDPRNYESPAAQIAITTVDGKRLDNVVAFSPQLAEAALKVAQETQGKQGTQNLFEVNGTKYFVILRDFEKVSSSHTLTIQYDPGRIPVYIGFSLLSVALCGVFFFAHQRVWAVIEPHGKGSKVYFGGNTNRNRPAFEGRFNSLVKSVVGGGEEDE